MKSNHREVVAVFLVVLLSGTSGFILESVLLAYDVRSLCKTEHAPVPLDECQNVRTTQYVKSGAICYSRKTQSLYRCVYGRWLNLSKDTVYDHSIKKRVVDPVSIGVMVGFGGVLLGGLLGGLIGSSSQKPPNKPPSISCPRITPVMYAANGTMNRKVEWKTPKANDPEDGRIGVSLVSGQKSGSSFSRGHHTIIYSTSDSNGLKDFCHMSFEIKVHTCNPLPWPDNGYVHCNNQEFIEGSSCQYRCNEGHELNGQQKIICSKSKATKATTTTCVRKKCPVLTHPANGKVVCSNGNYYGSVCSTSCNNGYGLVSFAFPQCTKDKTWTSKLPHCVDKQPPKITVCPQPNTTYADRGKYTATVTWADPVAEDNSGSPTIKLTKGQPPGSEFTTGFHEIRYQATDNDGNKSPECIFFITVEKIMCDPPNIEDSYMIYKCQDGYKYGAACRLSCRGSYPLIGNDTITCEKSGKNGSAAGNWIWDTEKQYCKQNPCPDLPAPANGALACDKWMFGVMCMMQCNENFDLPLGGSYGALGNFNGMFVCSTSSGQWSPDTTKGIPGCTGRRNPRFAVLSGKFSFYTGSCNDSSTQQEIKSNFIKRLEDMQLQPGWQGICPDKSQCNVDNVVVKCGPIKPSHHRGKRSADVNLRGKNETDYEIEVSFDIKKKWEDNITNTYDAYLQSDSILQQLSTVMESNVRNGFFDVENVTLNKDTVEFGTSYINCEPGRFPSYTTLTCGVCPFGTFLDETLRECVACPVGTYKDDQEALECTKCPHGMITLDIASQNETDCRDLCKPGYYSVTGLEPCLPCPVSTYQSSEMSTDCVPCPKDKTTATTTSQSYGDCRDFDVGLRKSNQSTTKIRLAEKNLLDNVTIAAWIKISTEDGQFSLNYILDENIALSLEVRDRIIVHVYGSMLDTYTPVDVNVWQHIGLTITSDGQILRFYKDGELSFQHVLDCSRENNTVPSMTSDASVFFKRLNQDVYLSGFFMVPSYLSSSEMLALTAACVIPRNDSVISMDDFKSSQEDDMEFVIPSECDARDNCIPDPCKGHTCIDDYEGYRCVCRDGYSGKNCEVPPDFCYNHKCANGATCKNGNRHYTCECPFGYKGYFCEVEIINGNWSEWSDWSECSATCGGGRKTRGRKCENPPPDPEGLPCFGISLQNESCNAKKCPSCSDLPPTLGTEVSCIEETNALRCVVMCERDKTYPPGFQPLDVYKCDKETNFQWNGIPPSCSRVENPRSLRVNTVVQLTEEVCQEKTEIESNIWHKARILQCVKNSTCNLDVTLQGCMSNETSVEREVMNLSLSLTMPIPEGDNLELASYFTSDSVTKGMLNHIVAVTELSASLKGLKTQPEILALDYINKTTSNITFETIIADCSEGRIQTETFCIKCPPGTFYDRQEGCTSCKKGTFQDQHGQHSCLACPEGYTTPSVGAIYKKQCTEEINSTENGNGLLVMQ